jgi:hypothetical protein
MDSPRVKESAAYKQGHRDDGPVVLSANLLAQFILVFVSIKRHGKGY